MARELSARSAGAGRHQRRRREEAGGLRQRAAAAAEDRPSRARRPQIRGCPRGTHAAIGALSATLQGEGDAQFPPDTSTPTGLGLAAGGRHAARRASPGQRRARLERDGDQGHCRQRAERDPADTHHRHGARRGTRRAERHPPALRRLLFRSPRPGYAQRQPAGRGGRRHAHCTGWRDSGIRRPAATRRSAGTGGGGVPHGAGEPARKRRQTRRRRRREGRGRSHVAAAQGRRRHARRALHTERRSRSLAPTSEPRPAEPADTRCQACPRHGRGNTARVGQCHAVHAPRPGAVLVARPTGAEQCNLCARLQRGQEPRRPGQRPTHG